MVKVLAPSTLKVIQIPELLFALLSEFEDVFGEPQSLPSIRSLDHQIPLKPDSKPFKIAPYRYPHVSKNEIEK